MDALGWQVIVRCRDNRVLVPTPEARRIYVGAVLKHGQEHGLYTHGIGVTHGHNGLACTREQAGEFGRRLLLSLGAMLPGSLKFEPAKILPIRDQRHLLELVQYCLKQDNHHGAGMDILREGTALFDYLGMRPAGAFLQTRVRELLPRLTQRAILQHLPVKLREAVELSQVEESLRSAALSVGKVPNKNLLKARIAVARLAKSDQVGPLAQALGVAPRTVFRWRRRPADPLWERAVRLQMALRQDVLGLPRAACDWPDMGVEA